MRPLAILLTLVACSGSPGAAAPGESAPPLETGRATTVVDTARTLGSEPEREPITVSLSLYVVSDSDADADSGSGLGTQRSAADVEAIVADIAPVWAQADIVFDPVRVLEIEMPADVLAEIATAGGTDAFFTGAGRTFDVPEAGDINGFYVREAAGVNGFTPIGSRVFFVVDEPTVNDRRVSSHEIGHIFGLHHELVDETRLMYSGTNGELLTDIEQAVARYGAQGVADDVR
jgi:hypothetical protein